MTAADDAVVLAALRAVPNLSVHDSYVTDSDESTKTISAPLPYVVFYAMTDADHGRSLDGSSASHMTGFRLGAVGSTREQSRLVLERARSAVNAQRLTFASGTRLVLSDNKDMGTPVKRDDTWTRPDGGPLFYASESFSVLI